LTDGEGRDSGLASVGRIRGNILVGGPYIVSRYLFEPVDPVLFLGFENFVSVMVSGAFEFGVAWV
jgi:hypothetical protein